MTFLRIFFANALEFFLGKKSENRLISLMQNVVIIILFSAGLFIMYLRFTRAQ